MIIFIQFSSILNIRWSGPAYSADKRKWDAARANYVERKLIEHE